MSKEKLVWEVTFDTEIYDVMLPQKVQTALQKHPIAINPQVYYSVEIIFDKTSWQTPEFFQYPLEKTPLINARKPTKQDLLHAKVSAILSEQDSKIQKAITTIGVDICRSAIIGDPLSDLHHVTIKIYEGDEKEYDKKGRLKTHYVVSSIMPDRPFILNRAAEMLAKVFQEQMAEKARKEQYQATHTPNMVSAGALFTALASSILFDSRKAHNSDISTLAEELRAHAVLSSDWPLKIEGYKTTVVPMPSDFEIDCPEFLLYTEYSQGRWILEKVENLRAAQYCITKDGYNKKSTARMAVLQNLKPIGFTLFAETEEGLVKIKKEKAAGQKKLNLSWKRK